MVITEIQINQLTETLEEKIKDKQDNLKEYNFRILKCTKEVSSNGYITYKVYYRTDNILYLLTEDYLQDRFLHIQKENAITIRDLELFLKFVEGEI
ncbi:hypothetical protein [Clostridium intestinale]|uniref:hypothetical protein n=1 Tax=Clostridium intestinale TaxID=36845 RepID=UPI0028EC2D13|nr:hypothetical protein [Clostridium intestinale]